ncbi:ETX/MTX2 family pore-forming toxin [Streptomyces sp. URMC 126]|uniref:ETX/MTX2 family pore-forming toxin n=1 Tax=Streptomyces sp. URMC 126 TaxID=3423401 RepID=UPI003F1DE8A1
MADLTDLQKITDVWAAFASYSLKGGGVWFTASTDYKAHHDTNKPEHLGKQVKVELANVRYDLGNEVLTNSWDNVDSAVVTNDTSLEQSTNRTFSKELSETYSATVTKTVKVGVEVSGTLGIENVASAGVKISMEATYSKAETNTKTEKRAWTLSTPVKVPAHSTVTAIMQVNERSLEIRWAADVKLAGYVAVWFNAKVDLNNKGGDDKHNLWFVPIQQVFADLGGLAKDPIGKSALHSVGLDPATFLDGYSWSSAGVVTTGEGNFKGHYGTESRITFKQGPLLPHQSPDSLPDSPVNPPAVYEDPALPGDDESSQPAPAAA